MRQIILDTETTGLYPEQGHRVIELAARQSSSRHGDAQSTKRLFREVIRPWVPEDVLTRPKHLPPNQAAEDVRNYLRYLASQSHLQEIHFLWRPFLRDPNDDMVSSEE